MKTTEKKCAAKCKPDSDEQTVLFFVISKNRTALKLKILFSFLLAKGFFLTRCIKHLLCSKSKGLRVGWASVFVAWLLKVSASLSLNANCQNGVYRQKIKYIQYTDWWSVPIVAGTDSSHHLPNLELDKWRKINGWMDGWIPRQSWLIGQVQADASSD